MTASFENVVRTERASTAPNSVSGYHLFPPTSYVTMTASEPEGIEECPIHSRLLNLWLTGEWRCPGCGGPDRLTAARLHDEYTVNPKGE
jgi:hypothetical protein